MKKVVDMNPLFDIFGINEYLLKEVVDMTYIAYGIEVEHGPRTTLHRGVGYGALRIHRSTRDAGTFSWMLLCR